MKNKENIAGILCLIAMFFVIINLFAVAFPQYAAIFFAQGKTVEAVVAKYEKAPKEAKVKILIVPGHEADFGGALYNGLIERDMNVALAEKILSELSLNEKFQIILARDYYKWNPILADYFTKNLEAIKKWKDDQKGAMLSLVKNGKIQLIDSVPHSTAPTAQALRLYGINKWANENKVDIVLHVHFNDNYRKNGVPKYSGFSVYVPEEQYSNATSSVALAGDLLAELLRIGHVSTLEPESAGVVEDQDLIAIGSYNTADALSVLIEYGYIYESQFKTRDLRTVFYDKAAKATTQGVVNFFESRSSF